MSGMIDTYRGYVSMQECDEMGHMNIQHYISKTSDASFNFRVAIGMGFSHQRESGLGYVALEHHIRFHRELRTSDLVLVKSGVIEIRDKTMRMYQEMREVLDDRLAATFIVDVGCLDLKTRRLVPWPEETRKNAEALVVAEPEYAQPRGLAREIMDRDVSAVRAHALDMFESNRSVVNTWECDTNGHMNARFFMARFSDAQGHMWAHAGLGRHQQTAAGLATATVEMRLIYFREMMAGETLCVKTGLVEAGEKTLRYRHWLFNAETGEPACAAEGLGLLFDKTTRKAVRIPDNIAARFVRG